VTEPVTEDWAAVGEAVRDRRRELNFSRAQLARETGPSETTIRYIGQPNTRRTKSVLAALSAVLGWRPDYLTDILDGYPGRNVPALEDALLETPSEKVGELKNGLRAIEILVVRRAERVVRGVRRLGRGGLAVMVDRWPHRGVATDPLSFPARSPDGPRGGRVRTTRN
jgi:transcriptional regulator with XRE-family HTH domain